MTSYLKTPRSLLRYIVGTDLFSDVDEGFKTLAQDIDTQIMSYSQGATGAKPAPGQTNRFWRDTTIGRLWHDGGSDGFQNLFTTDAISTLSIANAYSAPMTARTDNTEYEVSATRHAFVVLTIKPATAGNAVAIKVFAAAMGYVSAREAGKPCHFALFVGKGQKWSVHEEPGGAAAIKSSYLIL